MRLYYKVTWPGSDKNIHYSIGFMYKMGCKRLFSIKFCITEVINVTRH